MKLRSLIAPTLIALGLIGIALLARGLSGRDGLQSWMDRR